MGKRWRGSGGGRKAGYECTFCILGFSDSKKNISDITVKSSTG